MPEFCIFCREYVTPPCKSPDEAYRLCGKGDGYIKGTTVLRLLPLVLLSGCAGVINSIAPTDCYDAKSSSVTVTRDGQVLIAKPAETIRFCPPSIRKVTPE